MTVISAPNGQNIHSVTTLNRLARNILTSEIGLIWLNGEVSNFTRAASGHWYFTLKDDRAQVRCAMFRTTNRTVRAQPREGDKVLVRASVGIYEARGDYQLVIESLQPEGEGQLKLAFEQLKNKLQSEGLFSEHRKQPIPHKISKVGVITSAQGAALHDVLSVLKRRSPATQIVVYPAMVQGELAPRQLRECISIANTRNEVDVLLLTRGGGSLEDLWCFNDESLARAIVASRLPVISAVGHEVDITIADFVADLRAPTPSAAAELVSMDQGETEKHVKQLRQRLGLMLNQQLAAAGHKLTVLLQRLQNQHPSVTLQQQSQQIDQLVLRLESHLVNRVHRLQSRAAQLDHRLARRHPAHDIANFNAQTKHLKHRLTSQMHRLLETDKHKLGTLAHLLQSVSPLATMARGYSITLKNDEAVTHITEVAVNDKLISCVSDGEVESLVTRIKPHATDS